MAIANIMRDKNYKTFSQRLSDENIAWLKEENKNFGSWNLLFNELRKLYVRQMRKKKI